MREILRNLTGLIPERVAIIRRRSIYYDIVITTGDATTVWNPAPILSDLISMWRATEVLMSVELINEDTIRDAFWAVRRAYHVGTHSTQNIVNLIGQAELDRIMRLTPPETIIAEMLASQSEELPATLEPITDDVRAGTLDWRIEFDQHGIRHPSVVDEEKQRHQVIVNKHQRLLASYMRHCELSKTSGLRESIPQMLVELDEQNTQHSMRVSVAVAGVIAKVAECGLALMMMPTDAEFRSFVTHTRSEASLVAAHWLLHLRGRDRASEAELAQHLLELMDQHFPSYIVPELEKMPA